MRYESTFRSEDERAAATIRDVNQAVVGNLAVQPSNWDGLGSFGSVSLAGMRLGFIVSMGLLLPPPEPDGFRQLSVNIGSEDLVFVSWSIHRDLSWKSASRD